MKLFRICSHLLAYEQDANEWHLLKCGVFEKQAKQEYRFVAKSIHQMFAILGEATDTHQSAMVYVDSDGAFHFEVFENTFKEMEYDCENGYWQPQKD